jgi:GTPase
MFLDEAHITVHGGDGGNGLVSWRREKFIAKGGPWGGDGGNGGNVIFVADNNTDTLTTFAQEKVFSAESGGHGGKARMHGKNGEDLILKVPPGTVISEIVESGELRLSAASSVNQNKMSVHQRNPGSSFVGLPTTLKLRGASRTSSPSAAEQTVFTTVILADLKKAGDTITVAHGGRGGYGNAHFASSIRQAPDFAEKGEPGKTKQLKLELKLVADVGIIGYPSTGKSTLISVISNCKPKIADYEFTTLVPNLGVVNVHDRSFIVCDVPGLIEGASEGKGLGDTFLKHIERCGVLVHLLDVNRKDIVADYKAIRKELAHYSPTLSEKKELIVLNKIDIVQNDASLFVEELEKNNIDVFAVISAATTNGIQEFLNKLLPIVLEEREKRTIDSEEETDRIPILRPQSDSNRTDAFTIEIHPDNRFVVHGKRIEQIAAMTDWQSAGGMGRFRDICERTGLKKSLERSGANNQSKVCIGKTDVTGKW